MSDAHGNDGWSQSEKFKEAARELECDDDEQRFRERVGKLVKHKPVERGGDGAEQSRTDGG